MGNILQDMMGMLFRKKEVVPKTDDFITIARYANSQERMKPTPKVQTELVTVSGLKTLINDGGAGVTASNGLTKTSTDIVMGGAIIQDTYMQLNAALTFGVYGANGFGFYIYDDTGHVSAMGDVANGKAVTISNDVLNIVHPTEMNIVSDAITIRDASDTNSIKVTPDSIRVTTAKLLMIDIPAYVNTAAAAADGSLASDASFTVTNGDGTKAFYIKE